MTDKELPETIWEIVLPSLFFVTKTNFGSALLGRGDGAGVGGGAIKGRTVGTTTGALLYPRSIALRQINAQPLHFARKFLQIVA